MTECTTALFQGFETEIKRTGVSYREGMSMLHALDELLWYENHGVEYAADIRSCTKKIIAEGLSANTIVGYLVNKDGFETDVTHTNVRENTNAPLAEELNKLSESMQHTVFDEAEQLLKSENYEEVTP